MKDLFKVRNFLIGYGLSLAFLVLVFIDLVFKLRMIGKFYFSLIPTSILNPFMEAFGFYIGGFLGSFIIYGLLFTILVFIYRKLRSPSSHQEIESSKV